jgi:hypothetical protein
MNVIVASTQVNGSSTLKAELKLALIRRLPRMCGAKDEACSGSIIHTKQDVSWRHHRPAHLPHSQCCAVLVAKGLEVMTRSSIKESYRFQHSAR